MTSLRTEDLDYHLPPERIAQRPLDRRDESRLLRLDRRTGRIEHHTFRDLPRLLGRPTLLVVNDSRVFPARLVGTRESGGSAELLLVRQVGSTEAGGELWRCLGKPRKRLRPGTPVDFGPISGLIRERDDEWIVAELSAAGGLSQALRQAGHVPLPPYIRRADEPLDRLRYQTIFARGPDGSVAAPTAGLHFSEELLAELSAAGHRLTSVTLHVGPGTFRPVRTDRLEAHHMDGERYEVSEEVAGEISRARAEERRVVAVGTTSVRTLESVARGDGTVEAGGGTTELYILPGHRFRVVDALVTNFHLPRSTLLALVCAFAGREAVLAAYDEALREGYRFYSYGDAMAIL